MRGRGYSGRALQHAHARLSKAMQTVGNSEQPRQAYDSRKQKTGKNAGRAIEKRQRSPFPAPAHTTIRVGSGRGRDRVPTHACTQLFPSHSLASLFPTVTSLSAKRECHDSITASSLAQHFLGSRRRRAAKGLLSDPCPGVGGPDGL